MTRPVFARPALWLGVTSALALTAWTLVHHSLVSAALVVASVMLFGMAALAARHLVPGQWLVVCMPLAVATGWLAEQLGTSLGWLFGRYTYTDVLGPRLIDVPVVIPLMWFALAMVGWVMAHLLLWRRPPAQQAGWPSSLLTALLAAMLVTAFDLGADPYFVYVLKAWVMEKPDGGWFGETVEGFVGWMSVSFLITLVFDRMSVRRPPPTDATLHPVRAVALLLAIYTSAMVFQMIWGATLALKVIAFFAMGIPLLVAWTAWVHWRRGLAVAHP